MPTIDLKNNKCVRLTQGKEQSAKVYNENPNEQAKYFEKEGCEKIHIVDLDAAFGRADINKETILDIITDAVSIEKEFILASIIS